MCFHQPKRANSEDHYPTPYIIRFIHRLLNTTCAKLSARVNLTATTKSVLCHECYARGKPTKPYVKAGNHFLFEGKLALSKCEDCNEYVVATRPISECEICTEHYSMYVQYLEDNATNLIDQDDEILITIDPDWVLHSLDITTRMNLTRL